MTSVSSGAATDATRTESGKAYDLLARQFDELQMENPVLAHSARVSLRLVSTALSGCGEVLDLGCGTGREALAMAALGKRVTACDPSAESIEVLRQKAIERGLVEKVTTRVLAASEIGRLESEVGAHAFDGGYASFSLSYEPDIAEVAEPLWRLLRPGAPFIASLFNRVCVTELLLFMPFLVPRRGLRRLEGEMLLPVGRSKVRLRSYFPSQVQRAFEPYFATQAVWAIPAIVPPNYLHRLVRLSGTLWPAWEDLDERVNGKWPWKLLGSHTAFLFRARSGVRAAD